ncbi:hypothetical protein TNCV_402951 [Trichonephila clavipes]|nr:hypothetical protein TNCV_402951 [Trichonephila clavipes]
MDVKSCKRCANKELLTSEVTDSLKEDSSEINLGIRKLTKTLDEKSETLLLQVISILESLDSDIRNSIRISRRDMYLPKIPGLRSRCNSITEEKTGAVAEVSLSTSPEKTGAVAEVSLSTSPEKTGAVAEVSLSTSPEKTGAVAEVSLSTSPEKTGAVATENLGKKDVKYACFTCLYFDQMDNLYEMQQGLLVIRGDMGQIVKDLLGHCKKFEDCKSRDVEDTLDQFSDILKERKLIEEDFEKGGFFHLTSGDPIGSVRLSSQMMYYKFLLLENDKYIQTFKSAHFLMTQLMRRRKCLQKEASSSEMKEMQL